MSTAKVAVSLDRKLLGKLDRLVKGKVFANRSLAVQTAVREKIESLEHTLLARECAKLDPKEEQAEADIGLAEDLKEWPEY
jgi:metal-responsive CopG/Arc/MetJ family transcriptional regulator